MNRDPKDGPQAKITHRSTIVHTYRYFFYLANEMAYRSREEAKRGNEGNAMRDSIATVIFSYTYIETYFYDLMNTSDIQDLFNAMSDRLRDRLLERSPLDEQIEYVVLHYPGSKISKLNRGEEPYQSFRLLADLRNSLIHYKPKEEVVSPTSEGYRKAYKQLENRITGRFATEEKPHLGFVYRCFTSDCARWAFEFSCGFTDWLSETLSIEKHHLPVLWPLDAEQDEQS